MRVLVRCALIAGLAGFAGLPLPAAHAVVGGHPSGRYHRYVVMVLGPHDTRPRCSGVWLRSDAGRRVVLTAAHCLAPLGHQGSGVRVSFAARWSASAPTYTASFYVDPHYDAASHRHDLAVLVLNGHPRVPTAQLAQPSTVDGYHRGQSLTTVGFGDPDRGVRKSARELVVRHSRLWLYLKPGDGNSCMGDSGGPDLVRGHPVVVALIDKGSCSADQDYRVDTTEAHRFLDAAGK